MKSAIFKRCLALILFLLPGLTGCDLLAQTSPEPGRDLVVDAEVVERGRYRLRGRGKVAISAARALEILSAFDQHCAELCRWSISTIDHMEILESASNASGEKEIFTWTRIDDVLDATYFQRARSRLENGKARLVLEIPESQELEKLKSVERSHKPFFSEMRVIWQAAEEADGMTRIEVEMKMFSDRFLVNMMPSRVLDGAEQSLQELFQHLVAAEKDQPGDSAESHSSGGV